MQKNKRLFYIMGVSGTGKTTVGTLLAKTLNIQFFDGDDFHPASNIKKLSAGKPLNDDDRLGWLQKLNELAIAKKEAGAVIACSALKEKYRQILSQKLGADVTFIYLEGTFEEIKTRMEKREGHFMPLSLLESQFETLEPPQDALNVSISKTPDEIVQQITAQID